MSFPSAVARPRRWPSPIWRGGSWHPNELGAAPSEIQMIRRIPVIAPAQQRSGGVFLFRFRAVPSHWAARRGWMAGVAGPYWDNEEPPDLASGTFSELTPFDALTVEQHVASLREALNKKGLVVP